MDEDKQTPDRAAAPGRGRADTRVRVVAAYALFGSIWILGSDQLLAFLVQDPDARIRVGTYKGWFFVALTSALLYWLMRSMVGPAAAATRTGAGDVSHRRFRPLLVPLGLGAGLIALLVGAAIASTYQSDRETEARRLEAVAALRADQVGQWLAARVAHARFTGESPVGELFARWRAAGDTDARDRMTGWLAQLQLFAQAEDVMTVDTAGQIVTSAQGLSGAAAPALAQATAQALAQNRVVVAGPYPGAVAAAVIDVVAPLVRSGATPQAVLVHRLDLSAWVGATLARWPMPGESGATSLVDAKGVVLLAPAGNATEPLRLTPETLAGGPAADLEDGHGTRLIAAARPVAGSSWLVLARMDASEALEDAYRDSLWLSALGVAALLAMAATLYLVRERQAMEEKQAMLQRQADELGSLRLLEAIADGSTDAIFAKDLQGRYLLFNREAARFAGKDRADVLGHDDLSLFPPGQAEMVMENDRAVIASGLTRTYDEELDAAQGKVHFLATKGPLLGRDGKVIGLFGISRDITERRRAELAMRDSAQLVQAAIDSVTGHIVVLDAQGTVIAANASWEAFRADPANVGGDGLPGCGVGEACTQTLRNGSPLAQRLCDGVESVLHGLAPRFMLEYEHKPGGGGAGSRPPRWFMLTVTPLARSAGGAVITQTDVTTLKRNAELVESERFVRAITDNVPVSLAYWDSQLVCRFANRRFRNRVMPSGEPLVGMRFADVLGPDIQEQLQPYLRAAFAGESSQYPRSYVEPDGTSSHYWVTFVPDCVDGEVLGFFVVASNVTELKHTQLQLQLANDALAGTVSNLEAFNYSVSHDLRAPLGVIDGFASVLRDTEAALTPRGRERLDRIVAGTRRMSKMIDDILACSRAEMGAMRLAPVDFGSLTAQCVAELQASWPDVAVVVGPLPTLLADAPMLRQVMDNLVGNAMKFSSARKDARVEISAARHASVIRVEIRDNGAGFDMAYAGKLFGLFQRLHAHEDFPGTGVGLAIVRRLVARHGGEVQAHSEPGGWTTFTFTLAGQDAGVQALTT